MNTATVIVLIVISFNGISGEFLTGGLSEDKQVEQDDDIHTIVPQIADEIRSQVAVKLVSGDTTSNDLKDAPITVLQYKTQVVAGVNYFVKAKIGKFIFHLRIYEDLQGQASLSGVKGSMRESDPIDYFD